MHRIAVLALHGLIPFDLAVPCEVFGRVRVSDGAAPYRVRVCGEARTVKAGLFDMRVQWGLRELRDADTILVPGVADLTAPVSDAVVAALQAARERGARIASICSGTFVLAAAGLLDGLRATTHWAAAAELAAAYPAISVDPNVLFVDNGQILSSAGASAGLDLCLHMIRCDLGATVAATAARLSVMPLAREGGQAQFIVHDTPASSASLQSLLAWLTQHLHEPLSLCRIADQAAMSSRTLSRHFLAQTGTTPLLWVANARVLRAQQLLETTSLSIERIAADAGFGSATAFRERFGRRVGTSPQQYRRSFGGGAAQPTDRAASARR